MSDKPEEQDAPQTHPKNPNKKSFPATPPTDFQQQFYDGNQMRDGRDVVGTIYDQLVDADISPDYASAYFSEWAMDPYEIRWSGGYGGPSAPLPPGDKRYAIDPSTAYAQSGGQRAQADDK